jgi:hypothetical protein
MPDITHRQGKRWAWEYMPDLPTNKGGLMNAVEREVKHPVKPTNEKPNQHATQPEKAAVEVKNKARVDAFIAKHKKLLLKLAK